jgi:hypothetical protein
MTVQYVGQSGVPTNPLYTPYSPTSDDANKSKGAKTLLARRQDQPTLPQAQRTLLLEKYSGQKLTWDYTNADGDSVSLSATSIDYQKSITSANANSSTDEWKKIIDNIKDEYVQMKGAIVEKMFGDGKDDTQNPQSVADPRTFDESKAIPGLPEYWNAENTSQRIVDFATSFISMFQGKDDEFVSMIKDAIEKGFSEAKDTLGKLPDEVSGLVNKTHALVMDKIDKWLSDRKTAQNQPEGQSEAVPL